MTEAQAAVINVKPNHLGEITVKDEGNLAVEALSVISIIMAVAVGMSLVLWVKGKASRSGNPE